MIDIVLIVVALAAVGWLLSRLGRGPTGADAPARPVAPASPAPPPASAGSAGPTGTAPAAPGPAERARDPWHAGDGAFVDGYIIGRYVERSRAADDRDVSADERVGAGDDGLGLGDEFDDGYGYGSVGFGHAADPAGDPDVDGLDPDDVEAEDGLDWDGFDDGFGDDDW